MTKTTDRIIHSNQEIEDYVDGPHLSGGNLECVTPVVNNDISPDWSRCCDVTAAMHKYILLEVRAKATGPTLPCPSMPTIPFCTPASMNNDISPS
jgi:hypothetical protein